MDIVAVGTTGFVSGFRLAGIQGIKVENKENALEEISNLMYKKNIGLILISDDISKDIRTNLNKMRSKTPVPIIYEVPSPGSKREKFEYRDMLKQILGV